MEITSARTGSALQRVAVVAAALVLPLSLSGCILNGSRASVVADPARYPISMTSVLPDGEGRNLRLGGELVSRGKLSGGGTACSFVYGATPATVDLSQLVNDQVAAAGGEGVAALAIEAVDLGLGWVFPLALLPFWPNCLSIKVTGDIVARRVAAPPPSAPGGAGPRPEEDR